MAAETLLWWWLSAVLDEAASDSAGLLELVAAGSVAVALVVMGAGGPEAESAVLPGCVTAAGCGLALFIGLRRLTTESGSVSGSAAHVLWHATPSPRSAD